MRIRTAILAGVALLVAAVMAAVVWSLSTLIDHGARAELVDDLERSRQVFEELQGYRQSLFRAEIRVVAEEPRLKAVAATEEITHATVLGVVQELRRAIGSELFLLTDGEGRLLADTAAPEAQGGDLASLPLVAEALAKGESEGVWTDDAGAYQVQGKRLAFGTTTVGVLVIGHKLDDRVAQTVRRQTGSAAVVFLDGKVIASSGLDRGARPTAATAAPIVSLPTDGKVVEVVVGGERSIATAASFPGYRGARTMRFAVVRSLDHALELRQSLVDVIYVVAAAALVLTLILAVVLARRVAQPVDALVAFTGRVGAGELTARAPAGGLVEIDALAAAMNHMVAELERSRGELTKKERLERELEIAQRIQTSILPRKLEAPGLTVTAAMRPASEVGGDYYDFLPVPGGAWIGIGDVAGHGLTAGLVMLMVQSVVSALARERVDARPSELVTRLNEVLYENVRHRLGNDEHVTFTLLRWWVDGRVVFAGAHEEIVVWRAATGRCELVATPGTWLGAVPAIARYTPDSELRLERGDLLVLYTDGITEAMNGAGEQLGLERVAAIVEAAAPRGVAEVRDRLLEAVAAWAPRQVDDVTLLVLRQEGV